MKKYLLTGIITLLPIALTVIVIVWVFNLLTRPFAGIVEQMVIGFENLFGLDVYKHEQLVYFASRLITLILLFFALIILGFIANKFFFRSLINVFNKILLKIPIVKTIYGVSKDITQGFIKTDKKLFSKATLVPFPFPETRALGLVSAPIPKKLAENLPKDSISVFVPTSPHPISGFLILTPEKETKDIPLTTEEVFKFLISCGTVYPEEEKAEEKK